MRHALWYGHGSFMGLQIHALPTRIENTFPTITFYSLNYRSTLFRIHICQKVQRTALWRKHHFFTCVSIHTFMYMFASLFVAVVHYIYFRYIDGGFVFEAYRSILNQFKETAGPELTTSLNQFEEEFLGISRQGKIYDYWVKQVEDLKSTGHIGNGKVYERDLHLFCKYDSKAKERLFSEIDVKYINRLNMAMEKNGCCGNTRMHTLKTLRAVINKAIKEKAASNNTYPFGKGGFEINKLAEETAKRYLLPTELELIKNSPQQNFVLERARRIYLFSYYCLGMSFVDMANLTTDNLEVLATGTHIVYKRQKTKKCQECKTDKNIRYSCHRGAIGMV